MKHQTSNSKHQSVLRRVLAWINAPVTDPGNNRRGGRLAKWLCFHGAIQ